ncbi:hypothetical protein [Streptomyces europaeiscabiei]|uniref:hypothetical protein n=1 Tax=Streptomyces europaeiscabiei TaxID=146819 RepID=UPI0029A0E66D|nr:hypothetical protein [Streptomyces europaeiscabiei]MDX3588533.1 hypothetical protein [Streptomyces europaeiscabiei]
MSINPNPDPTAVSVVPPATNQTAALAEDLRYVLGYTEPRHAHEKPGVWDTSGESCGHCARLAVARQNLAAYDAETEAGQPGEDQPETPLEKRLRYSERRNDELRAESLRRGKTVLEYAEKIVALERQIDEVHGQLGAEILRAGQAEAELRLAAEAPHAETRDAEAECICTEDAWPPHCPCQNDTPPAVVAQPGKETDRG